MRRFIVDGAWKMERNASFSQIIKCFEMEPAERGQRVSWPVAIVVVDNSQLLEVQKIVLI